MRKSVFLRFLPLISAIMLTGMTQAQAQQSTDDLLAAQRARLTERCLPVQFQQGRAAFRQCLARVVEQAGDGPAVLGFSERYAVAKACRGATDADSCLREQRGAMLSTGPVDLAALDLEAANSIEQRCLESIDTDAGLYRQCLAEESGLAAGKPGSAAAAQASQAAGDAAAPAAAEPVSTADLSDAPGAEQKPDSQQTGTGQPGAEPADTRAGAERTPPVSAEAGQPADTGENRQREPADADAAADTGTVAGDASNAASDAQTDTDYLETLEEFDVRTPMERLTDALNELSRYSQLALGILVSAGGLLLLLLLYAVLRRREPQVAARPNMRQQPRERRARSGSTDDDDAMFDMLDQTVDATEALPARASVRNLDEEPRMERQPEPDYPELALTDRHRPHVDLGGVDETAVTRLVGNPLASAPDSADDTTDTSAPEVATAAFSDWLDEQPEADQRAICTEFLVYWIAYADERYDPALKRRLANTAELTVADRTKRWALDASPDSLSSAITWLSQNATRPQLGQIVSLIMALLITERCVTPVQTVMLRLLADAFDIGNDTLEAEFEANFGHPLPAMPRPDRLSWWDQQSAQSIERWTTAGKSDDSTHRRSRELLGLGSDVRDIDIIRAYRRAARRCHPDRFAALGSRERGLAVRQFDRFEQARDRLLGVLA